MPNIVIVGTQWGDEGKGKIVDLLSEEADVVVRFAGGNNAGHTLVVDGKKIITHLIPSGVTYPDKLLVLGHQMVLDPIALFQEINELQKIGLLQNATDKLKISNWANLIMPYHIALDELREKQKDNVGSTKRGIGPAYEFKAARCGIRMEDLKCPELFGELAEKVLEKANPEILRLGGEPMPSRFIISRLYLARAKLLKYITNINPLIFALNKIGKNILFEGAQGAALDLDHGTYRFVTSSTTLSSAAAAGSGIGATDLEKVYGVIKCYTTRVGEGPFPTEIHGELGDRIGEAGAEYGATTGRRRKCGWLDLVQLRHAIRANGIKKGVFTKIDVLCGISTIKMCTAYKFRGKLYHDWGDIPMRLLDEVEPIYGLEVPGFDEDISGARTMEDLPKNARSFIEECSRLLDVEAGGVSVGADRKQTILANNPWVSGKTHTF